MNASLYALIQARTPADPAAPLLETTDGRTLTYGELHATTARYARCLTELGAQPGDRIAAQVEKSPAALMLYLACLRGGFVYLPMNTAYTADEVDYLVGDATPTVFVCSAAQEATARTIAARHGVRHVLTLEADGRGSFTEQAAGASADFGIVEAASDDLAAMLYTSGTTGKPKGAMLTHGNLASNGLAVAEAWRFTAEDVLLHALPLFHVHGLFVASHSVLLSGARMLWLPRFDLDALIALMPRATVLMGVPTFYTRLLSRPDFDRKACRGMRLFVSGSAPLLAETHREFSARTGHAILERYGMTETGMIAGNPYDGERVPGSVGVPFPGVEVRVADEQDRPVPPGTVGGIQVRGANVMRGYWRLPEKTRAEFAADGFFRTGDVGCLDARGYLAIVGRAKDLIISGGFNVYPKEIEELLDALPAVAESALVGVPHSDFGEVGVAVLTLRAGMSLDEEAVLATLKTQLANFKLPKRVFVIDELPRNTMGKVQKRVLRERYQTLFAGG